MTDTASKAIHALGELLAEYLGPAALRHLYDHYADEPVRTAILAIAADYEKCDATGYAVFSVRGDPDADNGVRYDQMSAVFADPGQAASAWDYCRKYKAAPDVRYVVCKVVDMP